MDIRHKDHFFRTKGLGRLRYIDLLSVAVAILGALLSLAYVVYFAWDKEGRFAVVLMIQLLLTVFRARDAGAATGGVSDTPSYDVRLMINFGIMVAIVVAFFWSLAIMLHSNSEKKVKAAGDINKMLLGFLIGSGKSFLGV